MTTQQDEEMDGICDLFRALHTSTVRLLPKLSRSPTTTIIAHLHSGEGVLETTRPGGDLVGKNTKQLQREEGELDSSGEREHGCHEEGSARPVRKPDQKYTDDPNRKGLYGEDNGVEYLQALSPLINERRRLAPVAEAQPALRDHIKLFPHQAKAVAHALHSEKTQFKGFILGDHPGLGKTLVMVMAFLLGRQPGDGPAVVVVPGSCQRQWIELMKSQFKPGTLRTLLLDKSLTPFDLRAYDVIVTSYSFITSEAARLAKFDRCMAEYEKKKTHIVPTRPKVTLFSGIWKMDGVQHIGRFLAFDEAHTIKNHSGRAFAAARTLRAIFSVVILATGTMLDNTWADAFALVSMLAGHPFTTMLRMRETFTDALKRNPRPKNLNTCVPEGVKLERLVHFLHAFTLSRPSSTVTGDMEPLKQCLVEFDLTKEDRENSNKAYRLYKKSMKIVSGDAAWGGHADADGEPRIKWGEQIKATQFAFHPSLPRIMELYRKADNTRRSMMSEVKFKAHQLLTPKEKLEWEEWRTMIREGDNCLSERVDGILDIINLSRDRRPGDSILILDESAYFLEILEVAITTMHDPLPVFRYTGDQEPAERHVTLTAFVASAGIRTSVMLSTRGAGGQGLNLQCANVVIRCGPWWKRSWEEQAVARCFRYGQTKPVWAYELKANDCEVEVYKRGLRKSKNAINEAIMKLVTLEDGAPLPVWSEQRADEYSAEDFDGDIDLEGEGVGDGSQPQQIEGGGNGSFVDEAAFLLPHASTLDATDLLGPDDMMEDDQLEAEQDGDGDHMDGGGESDFLGNHGDGLEEEHIADDMLEGPQKKTKAEEDPDYSDVGGDSDDDDENEL